MQRKNKLMLLFALAAVALLAGVAVLTGSDESNAQRRLQRDDLPITNLGDGLRANNDRLRQAKSKRFDIKSERLDPKLFMLKDTSSEEAYDLPLSHAPARVAIPAAQSDVVVVGHVLDAQAYLSNDRTSIYSEFEVQLQEVLKDSPSQSFIVGSPVAIQRRGGGVRLPSGKVLRRGNIDETMPLVGRRYILFLKSNDDGQSFSILTGYELRNGRVFPLDGINMGVGGSKLPQFAAYEGAEEVKFLNDVKSAGERSAAGIYQGLGQRILNANVQERADRVQEGQMTEKQRQHSKLFKHSGPKLRDIAARHSGDVEVEEGLGLMMRLPASDSQRAVFHSAVCNADAVVIGNLNNKSSQLTDEGNFVFTDYQITVEEVIKNNAIAPMQTADVITGTRDGGSIELNNRIFRAKREDFDPPIVGQRYLLFLRFIPPTGAYLMYGNGTFQLDGSRVSALGPAARGELLKNGANGPDDFVTLIRSFAVSGCQR